MSVYKILIVDDEPDLARLLAIALRKKGYETVLAGNGEEGLAKIKSERPHLVIFDIKMPRMDGYTFVRAVRKDAESAAIPLIALTSYDMKDIFAMEGVNHYFMKAVQMDDLFLALEKLLPAKQEAS